MTTEVFDFDTTVGTTPEFVNWWVKYFKSLKITKKSVKNKIAFSTDSSAQSQKGKRTPGI